MTREEAIKYWEQFDAEIDELATDNLYEEQMDALEKQREVVEFTISALRARTKASSSGYEWKLKDGRIVELRVTIKEGADNG